MRAPFPYPGGKRTVAAEVWHRFGRVSHYIEPFFGSDAVWLNVSDPRPLATVNDANRFVANFWRAVAADSDGVALAADWPVNETDMEARHYWLVTEGASRLEGCLTDPFGYDAQVAGWWVWLMCCWIGSGCCTGEGPWSVVAGEWVKGSQVGINRKLPHIGGSGRGINRQLGAADRGAFIRDWMAALQERLRDVRVACGDWSRVVTPAVLHARYEPVGVFLDPPYSAEAGRDMGLYATDCGQVAHDVREWCEVNGGNRSLRIALCGYAGEHEVLESAGWNRYEWTTQGGYGNQGEGAGAANRFREVIWFSPGCLGGGQLSLFGGG